MDTLIFAVDLGHFKAYRVIKNPSGSRKVELIESYDSVDAHGKLSDKMSDNVGRFRLSGSRNGQVGAKGCGEPHSVMTESEKRLIKLLARDINAIVTREKCERWHLAAVKSIGGQLIGSLHPDVKAKLKKSVPCDLTNIPASEILEHFK